MAAAVKPYHLQTLGTARLTHCGEGVEIGAYGLVLLAYLSLARRPPTRPELCELLWSRDGSEERHRLRQLVYTVKRRAPALLLEGRLAVDPLALEFDLQTCTSSARGGELIRALDLFGGPFLLELPSLTESFAEWRDRWGAEVLNVLGAAVHGRLAAGNLPHPEVLQLCEWLGEYDELSPHEVVYRAKALSATGANTAAAIELQNLDATELPRGLGLELDRLREQIGLRSEFHSEESPLVLGDSLRSGIASLISPTSRRAIILLLGESGVGKSRVLDWAARLAAIRGARVLTHIVPTYNPIKGNDGPHRLLEAIGLPELDHYLNPSAYADPLTLAGGIADELGASWTVIAVDNVNRADSTTKEVLRLLPAMSKTRSVLLVAAMNGSGTPADTEWIDSLLPNVDVVKIDALPYHLSAALIDKAAAQAGWQLGEHQRQVIIDSSNGIPGRLLQLTNALASSPSNRSRLSQRGELVSGTISRRIRGLTEMQRWILGVLVLSRESWSEHDLLRIAQLSSLKFGSDLEHLGTVGLLNTRSGDLRVDALVCETLMAVEEPHRLNQIRNSLAEFYANEANHARAATYFDDLGDRVRAGEQYQLAGVSSMRLGAFDEAERQLKLAWLRASTPAEFQQRSRLLSGYYCQTGRWDDAHPHLLALTSRTPDEELGLLIAGLSTINGHRPSEWQRLVDTMDRVLSAKLDPVLVARVYLKVFDAAYQWGMEPIVLASFQDYLRRRYSSDPRELAELLTKSARINKLFGDPDRALSEAEAAVANAHLVHDPVVLAHAYDTRALVHSLNGSVDLGLADFEESERVASSASLYFLRERYLNNLAVLCYEIGELDRARQLLHSAMLLSRDSHPYALANLAVVELAAHRLDDARSYAAKLRSTTSSTARIIGTTVLGLISIAENDRTAADEIYRQLHGLTHGFRLQLTDPSYTLAFLAACEPFVQFDARSLLEVTCGRIEARNVYSYLRVRLALARLLWISDASEAIRMTEDTLRRACQVQAAAIRDQAEALLSSF